MDQKAISQIYDVYLEGRYFSDLIFTGLPEIPRLGHEVYAQEFHLVPGGVATPAIALTRLGLRVAWPCIFGSDIFSQHIKKQILQEGVNTAFFSDSDQPSLRISVAFSFEKERAFLSYIDPLPDIPYAKVLRIAKPAWFYITNLQSGQVFKDLISSAREVGSKVFMDCQAHNHHLSDPRITEALRMVDVFSPNQEEACLLTGEPNVENALVRLSEFTNTVIIKQGAEGCVCRQSGITINMPAIPANVVDTTGAGDNFNCGFLYGQVRGYSLSDSLRIANICAGLSVQGFGGASTSPKLEELMAILKVHTAIGQIGKS